MSGSKLKVGIVGATGLAGQQFLVALDAHPQFEVTRLSASSRSAGKTYGEALRDANGAERWYCSEAMPEWARALPVEDGAQMSGDGLDLVFSAVESDPARELEPRLAQTTPVVSAASAFRYDADVPMLVPGVNLDHAPLLRVQQKRRGWKGFITPIPNCTTTGLVISLKPLADAYGVRSVVMTSLQACSGAGRSPGVIALDIFDNVIPYIPKEEEKVQLETAKILGRLVGDRIEPHPVKVSATCTRVPVLEGHTETVFASFERATTVDGAKAALREHGAELRALRLPSAPRQLIHVSDDPFRPQPRRDRDTERGMATVVGRVRPDPVLDNGLKWVLVSHNTRMGAASGAVLVAEYLAQNGYVG